MMPIVILKYLKVVFLERIIAVEKFLNCLMEMVLKYVTELSHFSSLQAKKAPSLSNTTCVTRYVIGKLAEIISHFLQKLLIVFMRVINLLQNVLFHFM